MKYENKKTDEEKEILREKIEWDVMDDIKTQLENEFGNADDDEDDDEGDDDEE